MNTDRDIMQQALEAMGTVGADWICEASHHAKKDQHKWGEPCPLQQRWHTAYQALRERLAQPEQEPVAGEPLPCPFCGNSGLDFDEGSTYRWGIASCSGCGASCGEIRREYPDKGEWHKEAIAEWNRRASPPAQRKPLTHPQIHELDWPDGVSFEEILPFARAIEAAHGIREKPDAA